MGTNTTDETVASACPLSLLGNGCCDNTTLTLIQTGSEDLDACEAACDAHVNCSAFDHTSVASTTAPGASMRLRRLTGTTDVCQLYSGNTSDGTATLGCNGSDPLQVCYVRQCVTTTTGNTTTTTAGATVTFFSLDLGSERAAYGDDDGAREPNL